MNALKIIQALLLLFPASGIASELFLTWDFEADGWQDGYRVYCSPEGQTTTPVVVTVKEIPLSAFAIAEGTNVRCYVRAYAGDIETFPSNNLLFTYDPPHDIVLPAAPGSITITWE